MLFIYTVFATALRTGFHIGLAPIKPMVTVATFNQISFLIHHFPLMYLLTVYSLIMLFFLTLYDDLLNMHVRAVRPKDMQQDHFDSICESFEVCCDYMAQLQYRMFWAYVFQLQFFPEKQGNHKLSFLLISSYFLPLMYLLTVYSTALLFSIIFIILLYHTTIVLSILFRKIIKKFSVFLPILLHKIIVFTVLFLSISNIYIAFSKKIVYIHFYETLGYYIR